MAEYHLTAPLTDEDVAKLKLGDTVYISGECFTCRSRLQKYIFDEGNILPFDTKNRNVLIHNGPIIVKENGKWRLVSFMPTSSIRFEKWGAKSVSNWNLKMIIGKTTMGEKTAQMMKEKKCVHASPQSVSPNLWIDSIEVQDVYLFDELGSIEAAWHFKLNDLGPFVVDIDSDGNNFFDCLDKDISDRKEAALKKLGIDESFEFTKLY
ncbi:MAG: fumarate hydratase C-terminal domain-containing protein [Clostridia bacterium]|nr:fumarate hydratase C-terminal domain-containing protein [Clostridia bacterium]